MDAPKKIFLNHAKEDAEITRRLYEELKARGVDVWFDEEKLSIGHDWESVIEKAIETSDFFAILFSSNSVQKVGYVNVEINKALDIVKRYPEGMVYILPIRLDECDISFRAINKYQRLDLFPENKWEEGIEKIIKVVNQ